MSLIRKASKIETDQGNLQGGSITNSTFLAQTATLIFNHASTPTLTRTLPFALSFFTLCMFLYTFRSVTFTLYASLLTLDSSHCILYRILFTLLFCTRKKNTLHSFHDIIYSVLFNRYFFPVTLYSLPLTFNPSLVIFGFFSFCYSPTFLFSLTLSFSLFFSHSFTFSYSLSLSLSLLPLSLLSLSLCLSYSLFVFLSFLSHSFDSH